MQAFYRRYRGQPVLAGTLSLELEDYFAVDLEAAAVCHCKLL